MIEYRLRWSASSCVPFRGKTDWQEWCGFEETVTEVEQALEGGGAISDGLEEVLNACGFEWGSEVREAA